MVWNTSISFRINMKTLSVVLATRNEEENIVRCINSVKGIANEIIVVDENSSDRTSQLAESLGAIVYTEPHHDIFHITKQIALDKAKSDWILQLDADEVVTPVLAREIVETISMSDMDIKKRQPPDRQKAILLKKHQDLIEDRDGKIGSMTGEVTAFFIPRLNMFLGKPLKYGGVYPDGVIRLVKKDRSRWPQKSVHEQIEVDGEVAWLFNDLEHYDSPTLTRYFSRFNRYTDLIAKDLENAHVPKNIFSFLNFAIVKPFITFLTLFFRHKGFKDNSRGFLWAFFSASRFAVSYFKYVTK